MFFELCSVVLLTAGQEPLSVVVVEQIPFAAESGDWVADVDKDYHGWVKLTHCV